MAEGILKLLWGAIPDDNKTVADMVLSAEGKVLMEQLHILTKVERTPGLPAHLFGLVAAAKKALSGGSKDVVRFRLMALKASGLM